jgi:anti-sigma factor ChrR (cupin superfamily)
MISEHQQESASLYALGALSPAERQAFEAELRDNPELRSLVKELESTIAVAATATTTVPLPPELKDKVLQRVEEIAAAEFASRPKPRSQVGLMFMPGASEAGWKQLPVPGASIKLLSLERDRGYAVLMGKLEPGTRYPAHINAGPEDLYILTGDLVIGDRKLVAGDFHHADAGSHHEDNYSVEGCTLIAVLTTSDPLVAFAMG